MGGRIALRLRERGHTVSGLVRTQEAATHLRSLGITPVVGNLEDDALIAFHVREQDVLLHTAAPEHRPFLETVLPIMAGTGKTLIHTSGSSVISQKDGGQARATIFDDASIDFKTLAPIPERADRYENDRLVLMANGQGIRSAVICPSMAYGCWPGIHKDTVQLRMLIEQAIASGQPRYVGAGENVWSNVFIDDLADLYALVVETEGASGYFFAENGECTLREIVEAIGLLLRSPNPARSWSREEAIAHWGVRAEFGLASNSRVKGTRARSVLGWKPSGPSLIHELTEGSYTQAHGAMSRSAPSQSRNGGMGDR